jgi:phospholipase/carboxylesterase
MRVEKLGDLTVRIAGGTDGQGGGDGPLVVLLHGFGAPGDNLVWLHESLSAPAGTRFAFPAAPQALGREYMGGRAWWWIDLAERQLREARGEPRDLTEVPKGMAEARAQLTEMMLQTAGRAFEAPPRKVVLGGFSQGAMLSLDVALHSSLPLAGLALLSGTHLAANEWAPRFATRRGLSVFMSHGTQDPILPFSIDEGLRDELVRHGLPVEWVPFPGGHDIPPTVRQRLGAFLQRVLT